ncbi:hypothetical protein SAMN05518849_1264 [Sphingobium sp. AP50]|uniref:hypothetical protein n=1 Tax=Sphingobium sp. AP50 TaxID=1884369 RepID=UPI0008C8457A|nr:hypothetical protein [Sphingobium sp. AP50]SEK00708.1 hypothetical protein SAMN05518849_1264 [Sphingobium sp. AP50]
MLPKQFDELQVHAGWCLATETERNIRRHACTIEELRAFADAVLPRVPQIVAYLDRQPLDAMPDVDKPLFHMLLSLAEIAPAVESYHQPAVIDGYDSRRFAAQEDFVLRPAI